MNDMKYYSVKELCDLFKLTENTIILMLQRGELKGIKIGRQWRVLESDLPRRENVK